MWRVSSAADRLATFWEGAYAQSAPPVVVQTFKLADRDPNGGRCSEHRSTAPRYWFLGNSRGLVSAVSDPVDNRVVAEGMLRHERSHVYASVPLRCVSHFRGCPPLCTFAYRVIALHRRLGARGFCGWHPAAVLSHAIQQAQGGEWCLAEPIKRPRALRLTGATRPLFALAGRRP